MPYNCKLFVLIEPIIVYKGLFLGLFLFHLMA